MADAEHLALIEQGVAVWNQWYQKQDRVIPDLTKANLSNCDLSEINLSKANLAEANLSNANLSKARLVNANLSRASLLNANLENANLKGANLDYTIFARSTINRQTVIADKYLRVYEIVNNQTSSKDFSGIDLSNSNLYRANLSKADLSGSKLVNVNFNSANLSDAYLFKADLSNANLQNANLTNAYFSQANLTKACLIGALCYGTYFIDANLSFADLKSSKIDRKTMIDEKWLCVWEIINRGAVGKNLSGADLSNANLWGANLKGANLSNAKLNHAILRQSNLERTNLTNTNLVGADVCGVDLAQANLKGAKLRAIVSDRNTILPDADSGSSITVKQQPIATPAIATSPNSTVTPAIAQNKAKSGKAVLVLLLGIIVAVAAVGYLFIQPGINFRDRLQNEQQSQ